MAPLTLCKLEAVQRLLTQVELSDIVTGSTEVTINGGPDILKSGCMLISF